MEFNHKSVLLQETIENLNIKPDGIYVDGTLGGAGHSYEIAKRLSDKGRLIGIDQDADAIAAATERLAEYKRSCNYYKKQLCGNEIRTAKDLGFTQVDGILSGSRSVFVSAGHSRNAGLLTGRKMHRLICGWIKDMSKTARDIVNTDIPSMELYRIIRDYGEDRFAKNIAKHIVKARQKKEIETTGELTEIIRASIPMKVQATGGHPAKRTFQAIRIELNRELGCSTGQPG